MHQELYLSGHRSNNIIFITYIFQLLYYLYNSIFITYKFDVSAVVAFL
jgi:hypothetical protein